MEIPINMESSFKRVVSMSCGVLAGLLVAACSNPSAPSTPPTSTTPAVTLTGFNPSRIDTVVQVGQSQTYQLTNVTSTAVITWISSDPNVLSIDSTGNATGLANGTVTLSASADTGQTATLAVQVVPVYGATWAGNVTVIDCKDLVGFAAANYCSRMLGSVQSFTATLSQVNSNTGNVVSGTFSKGEGANTVNGSVSGGGIGGGGDLAGLAGSLAGFADGVNLTLTVTAWNSFATDTSMSGAWTASVTSPQIPGIASVRYSLTNVMLVPVSGSAFSRVSPSSPKR
jgi:hypothetical protein